MRYAFLALVILAGAAFALPIQQASLIPGCAAVADARLPFESDRGELRRLTLEQESSRGSITGEKLPSSTKALKISFPEPMNTCIPSFTACGSDEDASWPIGTVLDLENANNFWMGMTEPQPPTYWEIKFNNVPTSADYTRIFRVESWISGESYNVKIKVAADGMDCTKAGKAKTAKLTGSQGVKITIKDVKVQVAPETSVDGYVVPSGKPVIVKGTSANSTIRGKVYGLLIPMPPTKDRRPTTARGYMEAGTHHWGVTFDTKGLEGAYILRVRRTSVAVSDSTDIDGYDQRVIYITK